jgi:hypothetical protein
MKRMILAAGALLMGTSALAYAGSVDKSTVEPTAASSGVKVTDNSLLSDWDKARVDAWQKTLAASKTDMTASSDSKLDLASIDKELAPLASQEAGAKLMTASAETGWATTGKTETAWTDSSTDKVVTASADGSADGKVQTAMVDKSTYVGTGGPLEEVDSTAPASGTVVQPSNADPEHDARGIAVISDPAFVPPGYNGVAGGAMGGPSEGTGESYPACTRAVTDNCIQLYERGVTAQAGIDKSTTATGGPYEPVADDSAELGVNADSSSMNGDGSVDTALGETSDSAIQTADASVADHSAYQGVGGPVEAQSGYPPCSPGPGDDRCIQLYERGVTGAGN